MSKITRCITASGTAVCFAIDSTEIVEEARKVHNLSPTMTAALGRTLTAASLMGIELKNKTDSLTVRFCGDGNGQNMIATADYMGNVRGYASQPQVDLPLNEKGHLDVSGAIGKTGMLYVVKDMGLKEPYSGCVPFVSGEIAEDITSYYALSEQVPTICALGVLVGQDYSVKAAGGVMIHLLPFADDQTVDLLEKNVAIIPSITSMLSKGYTPEQMTAAFLKDIPHEVVDDYDVSYRCTCSRDFVRKMIVSLGKEELAQMAEDEKGTEVSCQFCNSVYKFSQSELKSILCDATAD